MTTTEISVLEMTKLDTTAPESTSTEITEMEFSTTETMEPETTSAATARDTRMETTARDKSTETMAPETTIDNNEIYNDKTSYYKGGCEYGDRVSQCEVDDGIKCYNNNIRSDCCYTCQGYETSISGCMYGDKVKNCTATECYYYSPQRRADCCNTCIYDDYPQPDPWSTWSSLITSSSTEKSSSAMTSGSSGVPRWTVPVAASIGGVLVLVIVIIVVIMCRRSKKPHNMSPIDEQMYKEYKLSKRPPIAPPRHPSTEKGWVDEKKAEPEAEYAYINPNDVDGPKTDTGNRRTSNDPLPPTPESKQLTPAPAEYLDLNVAGLESGYGTTPATDLDHYGHNHERAHSNQYDKFPGVEPHIDYSQAENGDVSTKF
ncbi:uncharacterized protein LOC132719364 isoform X2 [Ruditapes philippinarum]|uniref:uncharacterized protein LOC132719364 isoform X2 n=1 Tax=Ruditapes philippinarum TaxID=129788 RepID=UPI00295AF029|nr:uncharacterized protein LOC132719364 isoform X2 [Ruditapes philippinarum]